MDSPERRRKHPKMMKIASDDILMSILSRNPAKSVIRFRCVAKHWFSLTHDPYFLAMHLRNSPDQQRRHPCIVFKDHNDDNNGRHQLRLYSLDHNACTLTNTIATNCFYSLLSTTLDGLICLASHTDVMVLNPTTNESITVPLSDYGSRSESDISFGFDPVSRKYKLVRVTWPKGKLYSFDCRIEVFALGGPSESWISRGLVPYILTSAPTCVGGVVYWMCIWVSSAAGRGIAAFSLSDERFRVVKPPEWRRDSLEVRYSALNEWALNWRRDSHEMQALHEWDGKLCFLSYHGLYEKPDLIDVWVLNDCTTNDWAKMCSISLADFPYQGSVNLIRMSAENALLTIGRTRMFNYYFPTKTWRVIDDFETKTATTIQAYLKTLTPISL